MKESDLFPPVRAWLEKQGYEVHPELFGHDIVAIKSGVLMVVELKLCLSQHLWSQCHRASRWADFVMGAIPTEPRRIDGFRGYGFGLLQCNGAKVTQKLKPQLQPFDRTKARRYRIKKLTGRLPAMADELAGIPACPAIRAQRQRRWKAQMQKDELRFNG